MNIDINIASVISSVFVAMTAVISYFLLQILNRLKDMEVRGIERGQELVRLDSDMKAIKEEQKEIKEKIKLYDNNIEGFWKELPNIIGNAVKPYFDTVNNRLNSLEIDIREKK